MELNNDDVIGKANEVKFKTDLDAFSNELSMYIDAQHIEKLRSFNANTFNANLLTYPKITAVIKSMDGAKNGDILYTDILEVRNGKLVLKDSVVDEDIAIWAQDLKLGKINIVKEESDSGLWEFDESTGTVTKYLGVVSNTLTIPNYINGVAVVSIQGTENQSIFQNADYGDVLQEIIISEGITEIGKYAFENCWSLTNITIPNGVTVLGEYAFVDCDSLTSITIPNGITIIPSHAFRDCNNLINVVIPESVTTIGEFAFADCWRLPRITIPNGVTTIMKDAFGWCEALTSATISESVTTLGYGVFYECNALQNITVSPNNTAYCSIDGIVFNKIKTELVSYPSSKVTSTFVTPAGVSQVLPLAFNGSNNLINLTISADVKYIPDYALDGCENIANYNVDASNTNYSSINGVLFNKNKTELSIYPEGKPGSSYVIPNTVVSIEGYSFEACKNLTSITIPSGVTYIGGSAFSLCIKLTSIILPSGITRIGFCTFEGCKALTNIVIPNNVKYIDEFAFNCCDSLTSVTLPSGLLEIDQYVFNCCWRMSSITIPNSVTTIGENAFDWCDALTSITINKTNGSITGSPWGHNPAVVTWTM